MENMSIQWYDGIDIPGVAFYIGTYFSLQRGLLDGNGIVIAALNLRAPSLALNSLTGAFNLASVMIQIARILISTRLIQRWKYGCPGNTHRPTV